MTIYFLTEMQCGNKQFVIYFFKKKQINSSVNYSDFLPDIHRLLESGVGVCEMATKRGFQKWV